MAIQTYEDTETYSNICTIDSLTRKVTIPDGYDLLGVQYDKDARLVHFQMDAWPTEVFDMSKAEVRIVYVNANGESGTYLVTDKLVLNNLCSFTWVVNAHAMEAQGNIYFWVCAEVMNGSDVEREWHTLKTIGRVAEGSLHIQSSVDEETKDEVMQLLAYVNKTSSEAVEALNTTKTSTLEEMNTKSETVLKSIETKHTDAIDDIENTKSDAVGTINSLIDTLGVYVKEGKICQRLRIK